jgi:Lon protease-like protein
MLEIKDVTLLPDGRSLVNSLGGRRFKVDEIYADHSWNFETFLDH